MPSNIHMDDTTMTPPLGLAATLHEAVALAGAFGPGARLGFAPEDDILLPRGQVLTPAEVAVAAAAGRSGYMLAFEGVDMAPVIESLCHATGAGFLAACLATPWAGRTVYQGHLFEGGAHRGNLAQLFAARMDGGVAVVAHATVAAGAGAIRGACARLKEQGRALALIDAIDEDDVAAVAQALRGQPLRGGSAWVAARTHALAPPAPTGPLAILTGALDRQTVFQVGAARAAMPVFDLDFLEPAPEHAALAWAARHLDAPLMIASTASPDRIALGAPAAEIFGRVARGLAAAGVRRFVIAGDETAHAVMAALEIKTLVAGAAFGVLRWLHAGPLAICIKPPGAGDRNLFLREFEPQIRLNAAAE